MVKVTPFRHQIRVLELPPKGEINIPSKFIVDEEKIISIEEFKKKWQQREFEPILIGEEISLEKMEESDEDFFSGLKVDYYNGNLFIVDLAVSFEHGFTTSHLTHR